MFLLECKDITSNECWLDCKIQINRNGITLYYNNYNNYIPMNKFKNLNSITEKKKKNSHYEQITENKLILELEIDEILQKKTFLTIENCNNIVYWLEDIFNDFSK
jgi:hypothetical protein